MPDAPSDSPFDAAAYAAYVAALRQQEADAARRVCEALSPEQHTDLAVAFILDERATHEFLDPVPARAYHDLVRARSARFEAEARARDAAAAYARAHPVALATLALPVVPVVPDDRWPAFAAQLLHPEPGVRDEPVVLLPPSVTTEQLEVVLHMIRQRHAGVGAFVGVPTQAPTASSAEARLTVDDAALDVLLAALRAAPVRELAAVGPGRALLVRVPPAAGRHA
jgi:hypothetical protein